MVRRAIPRDTWGDEVLGARAHVESVRFARYMPGTDENEAFFPRDFARFTLIEFRL